MASSDRGQNQVTAYIDRIKGELPPDEVRGGKGLFKLLSEFDAVILNPGNLELVKRNLTKIQKLNYRVIETIANSISTITKERINKFRDDLVASESYPTYEPTSWDSFNMLAAWQDTIVNFFVTSIVEEKDLISRQAAYERAIFICWKLTKEHDFYSAESVYSALNQATVNRLFDESNLTKRAKEHLAYIRSRIPESKTPGDLATYEKRVADYKDKKMMVNFSDITGLVAASLEGTLDNINYGIIFPARERIASLRNTPSSSSQKSIEQEEKKIQEALKDFQIKVSKTRKTAIDNFKKVNSNNYVVDTPSKNLVATFRADLETVHAAKVVQTILDQEKHASNALNNVKLNNKKLDKKDIYREFSKVVSSINQIRKLRNETPLKIEIPLVFTDEITESLISQLSAELAQIKSSTNTKDSYLSLEKELEKVSSQLKPRTAPVEHLSKEQKERLQEVGEAKQSLSPNMFQNITSSGSSVKITEEAIAAASSERNSIERLKRLEEAQKLTRKSESSALVEARNKAVQQLTNDLIGLSKFYFTNLRDLENTEVLNDKVPLSHSLFTEHFNTLSNYVMYSTLEEADIAKRTIVVERWVEVMKRCIEANDFNTAMSISSALNASDIRRLKATWNGVSDNAKELVKQMDEIIRDNSAEGIMSGRSDNLIPYYGAYRTQLTYAKERNMPDIKNKIIHNLEQMQASIESVPTADQMSPIQKMLLGVTISAVKTKLDGLAIENSKIEKQKNKDPEKVAATALNLKQQVQDLDELNKIVGKRPPVMVAAGIPIQDKIITSHLSEVSTTREPRVNDLKEIKVRRPYRVTVNGYIEDVFFNFKNFYRYNRDIVRRFPQIFNGQVALRDEGFPEKIVADIISLAKKYNQLAIDSDESINSKKFDINLSEILNQLNADYDRIIKECGAKASSAALMNFKNMKESANNLLEPYTKLQAKQHVIPARKAQRAKTEAPPWITAPRAAAPKLTMGNPVLPVATKDVKEAKAKSTIRSELDQLLTPPETGKQYEIPKSSIDIRKLEEEGNLSKFEKILTNSNFKELSAALKLEFKTAYENVLENERKNSAAATANAVFDVLDRVPNIQKRMDVITTKVIDDLLSSTNNDHRTLIMARYIRLMALALHKDGVKMNDYVTAVAIHNALNHKAIKALNVTFEGLTDVLQARKTSIDRLLRDQFGEKDFITPKEVSEKEFNRPTSMGLKKYTYQSKIFPETYNALDQDMREDLLSSLGNEAPSRIIQTNDLADFVNPEKEIYPAAKLAEKPAIPDAGKEASSEMSALDALLRETLANMKLYGDALDALNKAIVPTTAPKPTI